MPPRDTASARRGTGPTPTDAVLAACVAGVRYGPLPNTQWLTDAVMILRAAELDWDRLIDLAVTHRQHLRATRSSRLPARPPGSGPRTRHDAHAWLANQRPTRRDRLAFELSSGRLARRGGLPHAVAELVAETSGESARPDGRPAARAPLRQMERRAPLAAPVCRGTPHAPSGAGGRETRRPSDHVKAIAAWRSSPPGNCRRDVLRGRRSIPSGLQPRSQPSLPRSSRPVPGIAVLRQTADSWVAASGYRSYSALIVGLALARQGSTRARPVARLLLWNGRQYPLEHRRSLLRGPSPGLAVERPCRQPARQSHYPSNYIGDVGDPAYQRALARPGQPDPADNGDDGVFLDDVLSTSSRSREPRRRSIPTPQRVGRCAKLSFVRAVGERAPRRRATTFWSTHPPTSPVRRSNNGSSTLRSVAAPCPHVNGLDERVTTQETSDGSRLRSTPTARPGTKPGAGGSRLMAHRPVDGRRLLRTHLRPRRVTRAE